MVTGYSCPRCHDSFGDDAHLQRHLGRKSSCRPEGKKFSCECGRAYVFRSGLSRHRASCRAAHELVAAEPPEVRTAATPTVQNIQNIQNVQSTVRNTTINVIAPVTANFVAIGDVRAEVPRGWQHKWLPPSEPPRLFCPPGFTITHDMLLQAMAVDAENAEARRQGDSKAWASLMVILLKAAHLDPKERNILLSPRRTDLVLVYGPGCWEVMPFHEAALLLYKHVAKEIASPIAFVDPQLRGLPGFHAEKAVNASRQAMTAHLENVAALMQSGGAAVESWLGDGVPDGTEWSVFGKERYAHMSAAELVVGLEAALGVYRAEDFAEADLAGCARRALLAFGRLLLRGHPENLTVGAVCGGQALVRALTGWEVVPAAEAARRQAAALLAALVFCLEMAGARHLGPLLGYLKRSSEAVARGEGEEQALLALFAREAEKYREARGGSAQELPRLLPAGEPGPAGARAQGAALAAPALDALLDELF